MIKINLWDRIRKKAYPANLADRILTVGSSPESDIMIDYGEDCGKDSVESFIENHTEPSKRDFVIYRENGKLMIADGNGDGSKSTFGTYLNKTLVPVSGVEIKDGDEILFGTHLGVCLPLDFSYREIKQTQEVKGEN